MRNRKTTPPFKFFSLFIVFIFLGLFTVGILSISHVSDNPVNSQPITTSTDSSSSDSHTDAGDTNNSSNDSNDECSADNEINFSSFPAQVPTPKKYSTNYSRKQTTIKTKQGKKYSFKTKFFPNLKYGDDVQSITTDYKYYYVFQRVYDSGNKYGPGKIVKYSLGGKAIKASQKLDLAHGQTLSYSFKDDALFGLSSKDIVKIDTSSLKVIKTYDASAINDRPTMTIDKNGFFYFTHGKSSIDFKIYQIVNDQFEFYKELDDVAPYYPGELWQGMSYNEKNDRIFLVSDDAFASFPATKMLKCSISTKDIGWTILNSKRETESLTFAKDGKALLLITKPAELLIQE